MNNSHPSEKEIQHYAFSKSGCPATLIDHIESCAHCHAVAETYQLVFTEIKNQPDPAFDFDISELVLQKLPRPASGFSAENFIAGFLIIFVCFCIGIPVFLFRHNILNMFSSIPSFFIYTIIGSTSVIISVNIGIMYKKFHTQMRFLNFN
jgi:hypothetical protein